MTKQTAPYCPRAQREVRFVLPLIDRSGDLLPSLRKFAQQIRVRSESAIDHALVEIVGDELRPATPYLSRFVVIRRQHRSREQLANPRTEWFRTMIGWRKAR